ncbi:hypothetical protein GMORB2_7083 [Geosmithia morbida]|uniref:Vegetative cell wall protein gp1 n=1 Tax=Geosmithia morbida TaxID=1094350 RepID=A0A9P5D3R1_9HYPO|nr:uncharacterized protein GMORB2_7083 [Geosmithia morbida]KAF4122776.1 hypothetical protein GMORB2_7083 [Geosmithia morbida]
MNTYPSPRTPGSTPVSDWEYSRMSSATPTPSPRPNWIDAQTPRRPATRAAHSRGSSYSHSAAFSPRPPRDSPRYNSSGEYATVDVSYQDFLSSPSSSSEHFFQHSTPTVANKRRERRTSYSHGHRHARTPTPHGESDEDEIIEAMGRTFVLPAAAAVSAAEASHSRGGRGRRASVAAPGSGEGAGGGVPTWQKQQQQQQHLHHHHHRSRRHDDYYDAPTSPTTGYHGVRYTNLGGSSQDAPYYGANARTPDDSAIYSRAPSYDVPRPMAQPRPPTSLAHSRRASASTSVPQRPSTVRPTAMKQPTPPRMVKPPPPPKATEEDAARHKIPPGFSLKNWDPREEPILLLGSVFDANSLGRWIYDWTVYKVGSREPLADLAGDLWLLLLELTEKTNRLMQTGLRTRSKEKRALVVEYLDSSERLMSTFRLLLKNCEAPMLKACKKKQTALGKNSGIEFVDTLFGRDRELIRTEKFMQKVRTWGMRFDANLTSILDNPTA